MRHPQLPHSCCGRQPTTPQERLPGPPSVPHTHLGRLTALAHPCDGIGKTLKLGLVAGSWAGHPAACLGRRRDAVATRPPSPPLGALEPHACDPDRVHREPCPPVQPPGTRAQREGQGVARPHARRPAHPSPLRGPSPPAPFPDEPMNRAMGASHTRDPGGLAWPLAVGKGPVACHPRRAGSAGGAAGHGSSAFTSQPPDSTGSPR